ncbi:tyrosinase family oxidase copper chaperone [Streptomyces sp. NPDC051315]|uniref:tyrosinase family oxidase copper chaperone n=1 Tax=Streptomyces sp. NPDC051315 TaxID=3365650 RepID=UPI0037BBE820
MVVSVDATAVSAVPEAAPRRRIRRDVLRGLLGAAAALALAPVVAASRPTRRQDGPADTAFDETYRGRRLRGVLLPAVRAAETDRWQVTVDGRPLHLMRRADGTWLSMIDHYRSYDTPLEAARAAVDELGPGELPRDTGSTGGHPHGGHGHTGDAHVGGHRGLHP